jgi:hypothetical protein
MCLCAGVVKPVTDGLGFGKMQGQSSVNGTRGAGAQDLVKSRTRVEALALRDVQAPLGRLEKARN